MFIYKIFVFFYALLCFGEKVLAFDHWEAYYDLRKNISVENIKSYLQKGLSINEEIYYGSNLLHLAARANEVKSVEYILGHKSLNSDMINEIDRDGHLLRYTSIQHGERHCSNNSFGQIAKLIYGDC